MVARYDIRTPPPHGPFDLVMCRNLAFTYFDRDLQRATGARLADVLRPGGALVLGGHEALPKDLHGFEPWSAPHRVYRRVGNSTPQVSDSGEPGSSSTLTDDRRVIRHRRRDDTGSGPDISEMPPCTGGPVRGSVVRGMSRFH
jgi:hypothetical protein